MDKPKSKPQEREGGFPKVFLKRYGDGKVSITGHVEEQKVASTSEQGNKRVPKEPKMSRQEKKSHKNEAPESIIDSITNKTNNNSPSESDLLDRSVMEQLLNEISKLKATGTTQSIPLDTLLNLLYIMEVNMKNAEKICYSSEKVVEKVLRSSNACLVALNILTSPKMPKRIYLEDVINQMVLSIKYQLENVIFPAFDNTYDIKQKTDITKSKLMQIPKENIKIIYDITLKSLNLLSEFLKIQVLTDSLVLEVACIATSSCFVENVEALQPISLKLVTAIFVRYEEHRRLVLEQILTLGVSKPNVKQNLGDENIGMVTGLVLQLIQHVTAFPKSFGGADLGGAKSKKDNKDLMIRKKLEATATIAGTFLTTFLNNRTLKSEDTDHKLLFESFLQDLILFSSKPKFPASFFLLNLLGKILVQRLSDKDAEVSLRVVSLGYLGVLMVWLKNRSIYIQEVMEEVEELIEKFKKEKIVESTEEKTQFLQEVLMEHLNINGKNDQMFQEALHFYITQWYYNISVLNKASKDGDNPNRKRKRGDKDDTDGQLELNPAEKLLRKRKILLLNYLQPLKSGNSSQLDENEVDLVALYLDSETVSDNFKTYLKVILIVLKEPSPMMRTKVIKCLSIIIDSDPKLLTENDTKMGINYSFLDQDPHVREAAVDLIGKFTLIQPELLDVYYDMLVARILDISIIVRRNVIKILRDICVRYPDFHKIPEIYVKIMRRVGDEGVVGKLVVDVFLNLWFTMGTEASVLEKVKSITDVVSASQEVGLQWFEQLLEKLFKPKEDKFDSRKNLKEPPKSILMASAQIVECLMENILKTENKACYSTTLHLFTKIQPQLLVKHVEAIQSLLILKCLSKEDLRVVQNAAQILSLVVGLIPNPDQNFLGQLEEDCISLVLGHDRPIVISALTCLGSIVNNITHNYKIIRDCFKKYYNYLTQMNVWIMSEREEKILDNVEHKKYFKKAVFIVGAILRHFDFKDDAVTAMEIPKNIVNEVFDLFVDFLAQKEDIVVNTIKSIKSICTRYHELMQNNNLKAFYQHALVSDQTPFMVKSEVLVNIESYLIEEDQRMVEGDQKSKTPIEDDIKNMNDVSSGMASTTIQEYLKEILESYLNPNIEIRKPALRVIQLILQQGLVHPIQIVPYLICMSTDCDKMVSHGADKQMLELKQRYPELIHTKSSLGIKLSYRLQQILQDGATIFRGFRINNTGEYPVSLNAYLYLNLRGSRQQRRGLVLSILQQFDTEPPNLGYMLYLADNLVYFPYMVQDELLFLIHHIDMMISVSGTNLLQSFREGITKVGVQTEQSGSEKGPIEEKVSALDEDDDEEALLARLPEDTSSLQGCLTLAQGCLLLLVLKQHLKDVYGLHDGKIREYSPIGAAKKYEKPISRRNNKLFDPTVTISRLQEDPVSKELDEEGRKNLVNQYLEFKELMLKLDGEEETEEKKMNSLLGGLNSPSTSTSNSFLVDSDQDKSQKKRVSVKNKRKSSKSGSSKPKKAPKPKKKKKACLTSSYEIEDYSSD